MALFIGEFEQVIDAKHRLAISSALREQIIPEEDGTNFIALLGPDRHLWLFPDLYYRRLLATIKRSPLPSSDAHGVSLMLAMARLVKPDSQGRIVLPEAVMRRALIADRVTVVGALDHIELWPTEEWDSYVEKALPTYGQILDQAAAHLSAQAVGREEQQ